MLHFKAVLARAAWMLALLVVACSGGAGGPAGSVDGGGPGGPVGGGNYAAGPVSLPSSSNAPLNPVEWAVISCANLPGPEFNCSGRPASVPAGTRLDFRLFAANSATARDSYSVTADAQGSWTVSRAGVPGESLEICVFINGSCFSTRYLVIPPENMGVEAIQGTSKSLVIDSSGKNWHSRNFKKPSRSWMSWIIGEAHAEESAPVINTQCRGEAAEAEAAAPADAPKCHLYSNMSDALPKIELSFDDCNQTDISAIVSVQDPSARETLLLVAVRNSIYVVRPGTPTSIVRRYNFPGAVTEIIPQGSHYAVLVASPEKPLYFLDLRNADLAAGVGCYELDEDLRGLKQVMSSHGHGNHFALVGFFENGGVAEYRVLVGAYTAGQTRFSQSPVVLLRSPNPMEVRILEAADSQVTVAVLQNAEKKLSFIRHPYFVPGRYYLFGAAPTDQTHIVPLDGLFVAGTAYALERPQTLEVNPIYREVAFFDFAESGTKLLTIPYNITSSGEMVSFPRGTSLTEIGRETPVVLRADTSNPDGRWIYGNNYGQSRTVQPIRHIHLILDEVTEDS